MHIFDRKLDDQDSIFGRQTNQRHHADLKINIVLQATHPGQQQCSTDRKRDSHDYTDR